MKNTISGAIVLALLFFWLPGALAQTGAAPAAPESLVEDLPAPAPPAAPAAASAPAPGGAGHQGLALPGLSPQITDIAWAFGAFILVLLLLYLTLRGLGRLGRFRSRGRNSLFELRAVLPLDNRKYLAAVEIEGRLLVLGVSPERISPLAHWYLDEEEEAALNFTAGRPPQEKPDPAVKTIRLDDNPDPPDINVADLNRSRVK
ncbi:MAG: flagellar biosynthetic protein FliO [Candidatus Adiutrix sp.]|jgi:flagellar biogenesis protein FliO|nr:flagellar biosynthetic protein FliO [Candidatus Adiutrix sp.]